MFVILYNIDKVGMVLNNNGKGPTTKKGQGSLDQARKQAKESSKARQKCKSGNLHLQNKGYNYFID